MLLLFTTNLPDYVPEIGINTLLTVGMPTDRSSIGEHVNSASA